MVAKDYPFYLTVKRANCSLEAPLGSGVAKDEEPSNKRVKPLSRVTSLANLIPPVKTTPLKRFSQTLQLCRRDGEENVPGLSSALEHVIFGYGDLLFLQKDGASTPIEQAALRIRFRSVPQYLPAELTFPLTHVNGPVSYPADSLLPSCNIFPLFPAWV